MQENKDKTIFGFWIYLMTDLIMFAALFATYAVLHGNTFGGPGPTDLFSLPNVLLETLILLTSSFTCGLATIATLRGKKNQTLAWFCVTALLGITFLVLELKEFASFVAAGHTWQSSAFLSAFFTLVGTHGLHIFFGLLWMIILLVIVARRGLTESIVSKLTRLGLFWHFLDIVWIFIFTIVYLYPYAHL